MAETSSLFYMLCVSLQLNVYIEERKAFMARNGRDVPTDMQRIRQLQRNNNDVSTIWDRPRYLTICCL